MAADRRSRIHEMAVACAEGEGGLLHEDDELLHEVAYLLEHPTAVVGQFEDERVRQLPPEVIIAAMRCLLKLLGTS